MKIRKTMFSNIKNIYGEDLKEELVEYLDKVDSYDSVSKEIKLVYQH
ncbi:hypothetical protein [Orientia tsutsugamushi]